MQTWKLLVFIGWILLSQTTYEQCLPSGCRPMVQRALPQVQQVLHARSREACETFRAQMTQEMAQKERQTQQVVATRSPGNSLRTHTRFRCQEEQ